MRTYEFWYNWQYAKKHNPSLMCIGTTGGFGAVRASMREYVDRNDKEGAERAFWDLIDQTIAETQYDCRDEGRAWRDLMHDWLQDIYSRPGNDYNAEIAHFVRPKWRTQQMQDTLMDMFPDDMCIPTMNGWRLDDSKRFAQELRDYINWVHDDQPFIDPMDPANIY